MNKQELYDAAVLLHKNCSNHRDRIGCANSDCMFKRKCVGGKGFYCELEAEPYDWYLPKKMKDEE